MRAFHHALHLYLSVMVVISILLHWAPLVGNWRRYLFLVVLAANFNAYGRRVAGSGLANSGPEHRIWLVFSVGCGADQCGPLHSTGPARWRAEALGRRSTKRSAVGQVSRRADELPSRRDCGQEIEKNKTEQRSAVEKECGRARGSARGVVQCSECSAVRCAGAGMGAGGVDMKELPGCGGAARCAGAARPDTDRQYSL